MGLKAALQNKTNLFLFLVVLLLTLSQASSDWPTCYSQPNGAALPVTNDCYVYIYCLNQTPFTIFCPIGMGFSKAAKGCVDYDKSDCSQIVTVTPTSVHNHNKGICDNEQRPENKKACVGKPFGDLIPYPGDCSKFLVCNCEYPTVKQCPGGTWFDNKIKTCNYPQNVDCKDENGGSSSTSTISTTPEGTETSVVVTKPSTTESNEWGEDCIAPTGMSTDICLKYPDSFLLRYPYNCNAYVNCTMGCPVMNYCPPDKVFNAFLKICDTPDTAHCEELPLPSTPAVEETTTTEIPTTTEKPITTTKKPTTTDEPSTTEEITTTLTTISTITPQQCIPPVGIKPSVCSEHSPSVYQTYPYNCTAYVLCKGEEACLEYCKNGKIFNSVLGICDEDIECHELPLTTTETPKSTSPISTANTVTPTLPTTTKLPPNVNPDLCRGKPDCTIYPYKENCKQYIRCQSEEVKIENCPNGWLFNSKLMLCDEASEDVCYTGARSTTEEPVTSEPVYEPCLEKQIGTTFSYKENCQLYYYCRGQGHYYIISCPNNNYYDPYSGKCGPDVSPTDCLQPLTTTAFTTIETTTLSPSQMCNNQTAGVTFPYEENCAQYIYCKGDGGFVIMNCPYNNYYYPNSGNCGPSDNKDICRKPIEITTPVMTTPSTEQTTEIFTIPTTSPKPSKNICENYIDGQLISYPNDCEKYISCVQPIPIAFYCNHNCYFNQEQKICAPDSEGSCINLPNNETTTVATPSNICQGLKGGDYQIYPNNCQLYYKCLGDGYYMLMTCNLEEYFDPLEGQCSSQIGPEYCKQNFDTTLAPSTTYSTPQPQGVCTEKPIGWKVNYPHNCSKYIVCESFIPVGCNCETGLQFSAAEQKCVEPSNSDCGLQTTSSPIATTTLPPPTKPYNQCTNKPNLTLLPDVENCAMFYICLQDVEHWAYCKSGEHFDITEGKCSSSASDDSCRPSTGTPSPTSTTVDPNLGPCYNKPDGTKIPYPNNCTKYIECHDPLNVGFDCPQGLEFSAKEQVCVSPELADCSIKTTTEAPITETTTPINPTIQSPESCENKPTGSTLPYPKDCSMYLTCINGKEKLTNCMLNCYYDPDTGECNKNVSPNACRTTTATTSESPVTITTPEAPLGSCSNEANGFVYANGQNCSQYFLCLKGSAVLCNCLGGTYYNYISTECDSQTSSTACKELISTTPLTTQPASTVPTEGPLTTTSQTEITPPTTEQPKDNICCGHASGTYLPFPGDKTKYVICQYPLPEIHSCPEGSSYQASSFSCKLFQPATFKKPDCTSSNYGETMIYNGDCTKYYYCFGSDAVVLDCSFDWNFNPVIKQCVSKDQYKCPW